MDKRWVCGLWLGVLGACGGEKEVPNDGDLTSDVADDGYADTSSDVSSQDDGLDSTGPDEDSYPSDTWADSQADTSDAVDTNEPNDYQDLLVSGPHRVGYLTTETRWQPENLSTSRLLKVAVWYPATSDIGPSPTYAGLYEDDEAFENAPPAHDLGPRPLVLFSHGNYGYGEQSSFLAKHLASHGYLVMAPYHTHNTFDDRTGGYELLYYRPRDLSALLDTLDAAVRQDETPAGWDKLVPFAGGPIGAVGHSYGGYTVLAAGGGKWDVPRMRANCAANLLAPAICSAVEAYGEYLDSRLHDPRIQAIVPLTPGAAYYFGEVGIAAIQLPTLLMTAGLDKTTPNTTDGDPIWTGLSNKAHNLRVNVQTAGHFSFSDLCAVGGALATIGANDGCGPGFLSPERALTAINAYTLAFLRMHLEEKADGAMLLSGEAAFEADVRLHLGDSTP